MEHHHFTTTTTFPPPHLPQHGNAPLLQPSLQHVQEEQAAVTMEMQQAFLYATAWEELARLEARIAHLKALLEVVTKERDDLRQLLHHNHLQISQANITAQAQVQSQPPSLPLNESASSSEESSIASSTKEKEPELDVGMLVGKRELPEKGRLLEAVVKAGPLLKNLLLAGPLPQWHHPPPPMHGFEIPPVSLGSTPEIDSTGDGFWPFASPSSSF